MTFSWQTTYYPDRLAYQAALLPFAVPGWVKGVTIHHTYKPTVDQWRGARTMAALERFYRAVQKWPAGPHLFLAPDGIWAGTPLATPGVHAGPCNASHIGLEIVGEYDRVAWNVGLAERVYALTVLLLQWAGLDERAVKGHRECNSPKSCPGAAINMLTVRRDLHRRLFNRRFVVDVDSARVRIGPRINAGILRSVPRGTVLHGHQVRGLAYQGSDGWARIKLPSSVTGYIWANLGHWEPV